MSIRYSTWKCHPHDDPASAGAVRAASSTSDRLLRALVCPGALCCCLRFSIIGRHARNVGRLHTKTTRNARIRVPSGAFAATQKQKARRLRAGLCDDGECSAAIGRAQRVEVHRFFSESRISRSSTTSSGGGAGAAGASPGWRSLLMNLTIRKMMNARMMKLISTVMNEP